MGNSSCRSDCKPNIEQFNFSYLESIPQIDPTAFVIKIQTLYRRYLSRKRLKQLLIVKLEKKRHIISSSISFKESWELHFKSQSNFEFSFEGLQQLTKKLEEFYHDFFFIQDISENMIPLLLLKDFDKGENFKNVFKKWILIHMKSSFFLGTVDDHIFLNEIAIEAIDKPADSPKLIKATSLGGKQEKKMKTAKASPQLCNESKRITENLLKIQLSKKRLSIIKDKYIRSEKQKLTNQPNGKINFFHLLTKKALEKQRVNKDKILLYDTITNVILFKKLLTEITELQNKFCESISYQDTQTNVVYSGSYNQITHCKDGIGSEYQISTTTGEIYKYCGSYANNKYHGIGMLIKETGEMYFGEWRNGNQNGLGYSFTNDSQYFGFFKNNKYDGYGELSIKNKFSYYGTWKNGKQTGIGFYISNISNTYCGEFFQGSMSGTGCFKWKDGQRYLGLWNNDLMDGYGEYNYSNGDKYIGFYKNDLKNGKGVYNFCNGITLEGRWTRGKKNGDFYLTSSNCSLNMLIKYEDDIQLNR